MTARDRQLPPEKTLPVFCQQADACRADLQNLKYGVGQCLKHRCRRVRQCLGQRHQRPVFSFVIRRSGGTPRQLCRTDDCVQRHAAFLGGVDRSGLAKFQRRLRRLLGGRLHCLAVGLPKRGQIDIKRDSRRLDLHKGKTGFGKLAKAGRAVFGEATAGHLALAPDFSFITAGGLFVTHLVLAADSDELNFRFT